MTIECSIPEFPTFVWLTRFSSHYTFCCRIPFSFIRNNVHCNLFCCLIFFFSQSCWNTMESRINQWILFFFLTVFISYLIYRFYPEPKVMVYCQTVTQLSKLDYLRAIRRSCKDHYQKSWLQAYFRYCLRIRTRWYRRIHHRSHRNPVFLLLWPISKINSIPSYSSIVILRFLVSPAPPQVFIHTNLFLWLT